MRIRKSTSFANSNASDLRSPQGRIQASGSEGRKFEADAEDGRFQPAVELRLPIVDRLPIADLRIASHRGGSRMRWGRRVDPFVVLRAGCEGRRFISV